MAFIKDLLHRHAPKAETPLHDIKKPKAQSQAFLEMLRQCDSTIFKVCLMFTDRNPENVKDMYQDIVCSLWESWPNFRHQCSANTWVYRIAINTAISQIRHRSLSPMFSSLTDETYHNLADENKNPLVDELYTLINRLLPNEKALLLLYLDSVPARDIGFALGITEAAVNHRIARIKTKLKKLNENEQ